MLSMLAAPAGPEVRRSLACWSMPSLRSALLISIGLASAAALVYTHQGSCAAFRGGTGAACSASDTEKQLGAATAASAVVAAAGAAGRAAAARSTMRTFGPVIRQPALGRHTGSVILLHGLGDTGDGEGCRKQQHAGHYLASHIPSPRGLVPTAVGMPLRCCAQAGHVLPAECCCFLPNR